MQRGTVMTGLETPAEVDVDALDWSAIESELDAQGSAVVGPLLAGEQCRELRDAYEYEARYRKRVVMARHGFGSGEYRYYNYPLPRAIAELRTALYPHLAKVANRWNQALRSDVNFPATLEAFTKRCHKAGQDKPTPLILRYEAGDFNCLHQDLYGELVFPLQVAILVSDPERDFTGGQFVLTEQRPRKQSRVEVVPLGQGQAVIFAVHQRPVLGSRGYHRVNMRHGVSRIRSGKRFTVGIIFHDAK
jgi:uncharacterized protein